ncbi:enoyl-CoA hydratase-related protein [Pseudomonas protegens]|uniref:enoyl-CoA hydratase/isomerase family protein n=1 Tax=Pseudomonas TaxID=286 RepID=UPI000C9A708E|nr:MULTISPECIES: enoyl-CoA hydratase-related protein [Pseudomonas]AXK51962.1 enoyl-CoA hydratase [Pseudomonas protegens]MCL9657452.1 enoyl-CoA hydratase-related protein [Pseudomonas protegens]MDP4571970.1 enoyl-CoA hydratase-related protein [Pseudomonas sp. LPH60]MDP9505197.1 enoyl-CoA hydratase-related protein [Pseudomonas protegens]PNG28652.1 enoyl-CoA hydratase [Pseudomonas protegens]
MNFKEIAYEQHGPVVVIRFNRPEQRNCIGPVTHLELIDAWTRFRDDDTALVAIITGTGDRAFCAGGDLKAAAQLVPSSAEEMAAHDRGERPGIIGPSRWVDVYKPVIAAVNGVAYAGGLEWACFADMRIAEEHASFGVTCRRWNIGLADGGTQRLPRIVGMGRAMELILTGKVIDAQEAYRIGLVNEIVPSGRSLKRALELAQVLAGLPQPAMRSDKEAAIRGYGLPLAEGLKIEAQCFNRSIHAPETQEGLRRFIERDHPDRGGRPATGMVKH